MLENKQNSTYDIINKEEKLLIIKMKTRFISNSFQYSYNDKEKNLILNIKAKDPLYTMYYTPIL